MEPGFKSSGRGETGGSMEAGEDAKRLKCLIGLGNRRSSPLEIHAARWLRGKGKVYGHPIEVPKGKTEEKGG